MSEFASLRAPVYRTPSGDLTCGDDFGRGRVCCFFRYAPGSMGQKYLCGVTGESIYTTEPNGQGYTVPCPGCLIRQALTSPPSDHAPNSAT